MKHLVTARCDISSIVNPRDEKDVVYAVTLTIMDIPTQEEAKLFDAWLRKLVNAHVHELKPGSKVLTEWSIPS